MANVIKSISAENVFSDAIALSGQFNFSLSGNWVATVHMQRSFDAGVTWTDVGTFHINTEQVGNEPETGVEYRFGVKTGNFKRGPIDGRLSQ